MSSTVDRYGPFLLVGASVGIALTVVGLAGVEPFAAIHASGPIASLILVLSPIVLIGASSWVWYQARRPAALHPAKAQNVDDAMDDPPPDVPLAAPDEEKQNELPRLPDPAVFGSETKVCPQCAETVKTAARVCRFCGYEFERKPEGPTQASLGAGLGHASLVGGPPGATPSNGSSRRTPILLLGGVALVAVFVMLASGNIGVRHTITGTFRVPPADEAQNLGWLSQIVEAGDLGTSCSTRGGTDDLHSGTPVTVRDGAERVIGVGLLGEGELDFGTVARCVFPFTVSGLPGASFYSIEVGRRGKVTFSAVELEAQDWTIGMNIGGSG